MFEAFEHNLLINLIGVLGNEHSGKICVEPSSRLIYEHFFFEGGIVALVLLFDGYILSFNFTFIVIAFDIKSVLIKTHTHT